MPFCYKKRMRIAFIEPKHRETVITHNPAMLRFVKAKRFYLPKWNNPSLSLLTVAGMVPNRWEVQYLHRFEEEIDYSQPYDIVATGGMSCQTEEVYRICDGFRRRGVHTVVGGFHVSALPEEAARHADTVFPVPKQGALVGSENPDLPTSPKNPSALNPLLEFAILERVERDRHQLASPIAKAPHDAVGLRLAVRQDV